MTDPSQYFKGRTVQEQMNEVIGYVDVRSAEVATDAIAADVAQVHQDMLDADADATAAAASAAAAAGTLANAVKKTGEASQSIAGDIAISGDETVGGDLGVTGAAGVTGNLTVGGTGAFTGKVTGANPSSGATDSTLVTANWISQTGDAGPNNVIHKSGNETRSGNLTLEQTKIFYQNALINSGNSGGVWVQLLKIPISTTRFFNFAIVRPYGVHHTLVNLRTGTSSSISLYNKYGVAATTICVKTDNDYAYVYLLNGAAYQPSYLFPYFSPNVISSTYIGDGSTYADITDAPGTTLINAVFIGEDAS